MHRIFKYSRGWMSVRSAVRMGGFISGMAVKERKKMGVRALLMVACGALALPMAAQRRGPLPPPPPGSVAPSSAPGDPAKTNAAQQETSSHITNEPSALPVEQIVQKFTEQDRKSTRLNSSHGYIS